MSTVTAVQPKISQKTILPAGGASSSLLRRVLFSLFFLIVLYGGAAACSSGTTQQKKDTNTQEEIQTPDIDNNPLEIFEEELKEDALLPPDLPELLTDVPATDIAPDKPPAPDITKDIETDSVPKDVCETVPDSVLDTEGLSDLSNPDVPVVPTVTVTPGSASKFIIQGGIIITVAANSSLQVVPQGEVLFENDQIACVGSAGSPCATDGSETVIVLPYTYKIYPGLIDSHNHPHYNAFTLFLHPGSNYQSSSDWRNSDEYADWKDHWPDPNTNDCQRSQYGIVRALVGGATAIQGVTSNLKCLRSTANAPWVLRQIDAYNGITPDKVKTNSLGVGSLNNADVLTICAEQNSGKWDRFIIHLSEGVQGAAKALKEFQDLKAMGNGCLFNPKTVFIHGNGLTHTELDFIAASGATLVWSPSSNTDLYGWAQNASLDVPYALSLGIPLALGPDWYPSHGIGMFAEMTRANAFSQAFFSGIVTTEQIFRMATAGGAKLAALDAYLGRIQPGMKADLVIAAGETNQPFETVYLGQVAGVFVNGKLYYGDQLIMTAQNVTNPSCEDLSVCGTGKTLCLPPTYNGDAVTLSALKQSFIWVPNLSNPTATEPFTATAFDELPEACGN